MMRFSPPLSTVRHSFLLMIVIALAWLPSIALAGLREDVQRLVRNASLKGAIVAVSICDAATGETIVEINSREPMVPASNMKLLTTGAALHALGPDFAFKTRLMRDGDRLIVIGDGDPAFGDPELLAQTAIGDQTIPSDVETLLNAWVQAVVNANPPVQSVSAVVVDDRVFDREFVHRSWPVDQLNRRYCAQVAGLNFHSNVLNFHPKPRKNQPPLVGESWPAAPWLRISNAGTSRDGANDKNDAWIARKLGTNEMTLRGNVRFAYKTPVPVTIHDMPDFFAQLLSNRLERAGVGVGERRAAGQQDGTGVHGQQLGPTITTPLTTVIARCNRESENLYAECMLKRIGHALTGEPGSWLNGAAIIRHIIHERLNDHTLAGGIIVADGSGLSQENRITAAAMTAWLNTFHHDARLGPAFIESLAVAGESGTLQKRKVAATSAAGGAVVQGKTGYISQVSCLSGYVTMPDGRRRTFSVLVNALKDPATVPQAKALQDQIISAIAEDMASQAVAVQMGSDR